MIFSDLFIVYTWRVFIDLQRFLIHQKYFMKRKKEKYGTFKIPMRMLGNIHQAWSGRQLVPNLLHDGPCKRLHTMWSTAHADEFDVSKHGFEILNSGTQSDMVQYIFFHFLDVRIFVEFDSFHVHSGQVLVRYWRTSLRLSMMMRCTHICVTSGYFLHHLQEGAG